MSQKINILFLPKWYPCRNKPLRGIFIKRHAEVIVDQCNVAVLYVTVDENIKDKWFEYFITNEDGIYTIRYYYRKINSSFKPFNQLIKFFLYILCLFKGYQLIKKNQGVPQIVHVHVLLRPAILALYLKLIKGIPYLITEHWTGYLPTSGMFLSESSFKRFLRKVVVKQCKGVTPDSTDLGEWMYRHGLKSDYVTVPNAVDTKIFTLNRKSHTSKNRIVHISSLKDEHKNVSGIISVLKRVYSVRQDFECYIVGNAYDYEKLKQIASEAGLLDKAIFFPGRKVKEDLANILSQADFFILFSNYENQPSVISESFACGVPVLATTVGDIPNIVSKEMGVLVNPKDQEALFEKIVYMLDNSHDFNKEQIREYALQNFSNEKVGEKMVKVYCNILNRVSIKDGII